MHLCMSLLSYFDTYLHTYVCVCVHMRACVHAHVCVCVYVWYVHLCVSQHAPIMKRCRTPFNKRLHADGAQETAHNDTGHLHLLHADGAQETARNDTVRLHLQWPS
jgi:hypothetical protein